MKDLMNMPGVVEIQDRSDQSTKRARVMFENGYALSVIQGEYTYGGPEGYFEIAPINLEDNLDGSLLDEDDRGDDVLGWCDKEKVMHYAKKLSSL